MLRIFNELFARYGVQLTISGASVDGFFFSVNSRSWQNMERMVGPLGEIPRGQYICILPISVAVAAGDTVGLGQKSYKIRRVEQTRAGGTEIYHWCLCVEKGSDDT